MIPIYERTSKLGSFFICSSMNLIEIDLQLNLVDKIQAIDEDNLEFQGVILGKNYLYECVGKEKGYLLRVREKNINKGMESILGGKIVQTIKLESKAQIMELHGFRNLLVTYHEDNSLSFWRP